MIKNEGNGKVKEDDIVVLDAETKKPVIENQSIVELQGSIRNYYDLTAKLDNVLRDPDAISKMMQDDESGGNKIFSTRISREIWYTVINSTKPLRPQSEREEKTLIKIYNLLFQYAVRGEYPLLQQLCNYLGINREDFFRIMATNGHPDRDSYIWVYGVFESAAQMNAIRGNGNANARQWIDKSREFQIATEDKINLTIESKKVDRLDEIGAELAKELLGGGE